MTRLAQIFRKLSAKSIGEKKIHHCDVRAESTVLDSLGGFPHTTRLNDMPPLVFKDDSGEAAHRVVIVNQQDAYFFSYSFHCRQSPGTTNGTVYSCLTSKPPTRARSYSRIQCNFDARSSRHQPRDIQSNVRRTHPPAPIPYLSLYLLYELDEPGHAIKSK